MSNINLIADERLKNFIKDLDAHLSRLMNQSVGYNFNKLIDYRDNIIKAFARYIRSRKKEIKEQAKEFDTARKKVEEKFDIEKTNIISTFERNTIRAFGQAAYSIEKNLQQPVTNPGRFGVRALLSMVGKKPKVSDLSRVEGFTRLTKNNTMHRIDLIPYLVMLIRTAQEEYSRRLNESVSYALGTDLAYISPHPCWLGPQAKEVCNEWRGKIVSLNGLTVGFPKLEDGINDNLFHPHCTHQAIPLSQEQEKIAIQKKIKTIGKLDKYI